MPAWWMGWSCGMSTKLRNYSMNTVLYKIIMDVVDGTTPLVLHYSNTSYTVPYYLIYDIRRMTDTSHCHGLLVYSSPSQQQKTKNSVWTFGLYRMHTNQSTHPRSFTRNVKSAMELAPAAKCVVMQQARRGTNTSRNTLKWSSVPNAKKSNHPRSFASTVDSAMDLTPAAKCVVLKQARSGPE